MSVRKMTSALAAAAGLCALVAGGVAPAYADPGKGPGPSNRLQDLQVLSFTDFHGNLEPSSSAVYTAQGQVKPTGGAAYLAAHLNKLREGQQRTLTLANGDNVGASPLISAAFHDEPTITAMNMMGVQASTIGNHEFDEGYQEMLRLIKGGCLNDGDGANNQNSCPGGSYSGANFPYVAANVLYSGTNKTVLPPYTIVDVKGIKVGVIGAVLKDTPNIVSAEAVKGLTFTDETEAVNKASAELQAKGVKTQILLVHQGAMPVEPKTNYDYTCDSGQKLNGPVVPIAQKVAPAVDMIVTGHVHSAWVCNIPDPAGQKRIVTEGLSYGRLVTEANLQYDPKTKDVVRETERATNHIVTNDIAPDPKVQALVDQFKQYVAPIANRQIGTLTAPATRATNPAGESNLGDLIADAMLADKTIAGNKAPQIAFMNPGGIREDIDAGPVTYGEAFAVQPFNNNMVAMDLTGAQIYDILKQQVTGANATGPTTYNKILQVSKGFTYTLGADGPVAGSVKLNGTPIEMNTTYRVATNNFLADGGDGFPGFKSGTNRLVGGMDIDALAAFLTANNPYTPTAPTRITKG